MDTAPPSPRRGLAHGSRQQQPQHQPHRRRRPPLSRVPVPIPQLAQQQSLLLLLVVLFLATAARASFVPGEEAAKQKGGLFKCAWQFETSHARCNMGVIDKTARYAGWTVFPNHRVYKLQGPYPTDGVYYALTVYDTSGVHILGGMADFQIAPKAGVGPNPYRDPWAYGSGRGGPEGGVGEYELHIITDGRSRGLPNEIVLDLLHNVTAIPIVILREYGLLDPSLPSTTLPRVSYLGRDGKAWYPIPTCDEDVRVRAGNARCRAIVGMQPPFDPNSWDTWATRRLGCQTGRLLSPQDGIWPFMALKAEGGIDSILGMPPVYTNAFSEYMYWCVSQHYLNMTDATDGVFLRIRGRLPRVASGVFDGPARAGDLDAYDIRYLSFTLADLWWPGNVFTTATGLDIERFYTDPARAGPGWDRRYSLVLAYDESFPTRTGGEPFDPQREMLLLWGRDAEHPQGAVNPIVVMREILPSSVQRELARRPFPSYFGLDDEGVDTGMFPGTMVKAHHECVKSRESALCHEPQYLRDTLETGYFPSIEVWKGGVRIK